MVPVWRNDEFVSPEFVEDRSTCGRGRGLAVARIISRSATARSRDFEHAAPAAFDSLKPLGDRVKPITVEEFQARVAHAQELMTDAKPDLPRSTLRPELRSTTSQEFIGDRASA